MTIYYTKLPYGVFYIIQHHLTKNEIKYAIVARYVIFDYLRPHLFLQRCLSSLLLLVVAAINGQSIKDRSSPKRQLLVSKQASHSSTQGECSYAYIFFYVHCRSNIIRFLSNREDNLCMQYLEWQIRWLIRIFLDNANIFVRGR